MIQFSLSISFRLMTPSSSAPLSVSDDIFDASGKSQTSIERTGMGADPDTRRDVDPPPVLLGRPCAKIVRSLSIPATALAAHPRQRIERALAFPNAIIFAGSTISSAVKFAARIARGSCSVSRGLSPDEKTEK